MAAYGSLVSLMNILDTIQLHPCPPISLHQIQVESLTEKITFLQEFLEGYSMESDYRNEADPLELRIVDAAYAAEDVIETHIVDQIDPQPSKNIRFFNCLSKCFQVVWKAAADCGLIAPPTDCGLIAPPTDPFCQRLQKVIEGFDLLKKEAMEIKGIRGVRDPVRRISEPAGSLRPTYTRQNVGMVGFHEVLIEVMDKLTGGERVRQTIPIVGMGGTGKTTLALNIYQHQVIVQRFDLRVWVTISQEYKIRECLLKLLQESGENLDEQELGILLHYQVGIMLYKKLSGRRYLIVLDDIWDIEVCDQLRRFLPDNQNGSRIVITTRISNIDLNDSHVIKMGFLDENKSWSLFSKVVFGEKVIPPQLEEIGKKIVENCRGLPLSIVVVGGLLAKSRETREYWEYIAENLSSTVNSEDDENCLKILHMSYKHLPVYLKPCFLYMRVFPEDQRICVSELIKLWVSEGFVRPISGKSLEEVAYKYLQELISRNMVLAHELGSIGSIKYCKVHDLLRDLSLRQAAKEMFHGMGTRRRFVISENMSHEEVRRSMQCMPLVLSVIFHLMCIPPFHRSRLLRVLSDSSRDAVGFERNESKLDTPDYLIKPSSFYLSWNLQTLIDKSWNGFIGGQFDIWNMPQLRHLKIASGFGLSKLYRTNHTVLANLQTLGIVRNFKCCAEVVKRIPNIKKLQVMYMDLSKESERDYCFNNFSHLRKLESLYFQQFRGRIDCLQNLTFPHSLKKLHIDLEGIQLEDKLEKIGSLQLLEKLKLRNGRFRGGKWETTEGQFTRLKFLEMMSCKGLKYWTTESSHFPCLDTLVLRHLDELNEIPSEIGEIPTLKSIRLFYCSQPLAISAKKIAEEQEEFYGEVSLHVQAHFRGDDDRGEALSGLAGPNFEAPLATTLFGDDPGSILIPKEFLELLEFLRQ